MAGIPGTTPAAILSAIARHCSPVLAWKFQSGFSGAAMNFCISGLMSAVGAWRVLAGTCRGVAIVPSARAGAAAKIAANMMNGAAFMEGS